MNILDLKRKLLPMGNYMADGGGSSSTGSSTQITELPEWARPYAKSALEKGAALSEKPFQAYEGNRIAGFSPLQQQAQQGAAEMQTSGLTGLGGQVAGAAALGGLGQQYDAGQFQGGRFGGRQAAQYMSPYIQEALAPQLREAQRSSEIMGQQNAAKAVGQGAFGGSRSAIVEAERQRNLGTQMGDIRAKGLQDAYSAATAQFNADQARAMQAQQLGEQSRQFGANLGLQGLNTALQGAGQLGALGGQEFQQGMDINKLQSAYGGQQQALRQQGLTQAYEDFQNQQNYPYKQLGFFSDLIRGLPLGQQTAKSMYEPNPTFAQQAGAIGAGAYGLSKFMAEGGMAYADGGSVDSADNVQRIVGRLSDQQLQQAAQAAQARGDQDQLEAIQSEMAMRASERRGIAAGITPQMADRMAGGGVVAFKEPTAANNYSLTDSGEGEEGLGSNVIVSPGNKGHYDKAGQMALAALEELRNYPEFKSLEPEKRAELEQATFNRILSFGGKDPYAPMAERIAGLEAAGAKNYERGLGAAAFKAIPAILKGGNAIRGIGGGLGAFGEEAEKSDRAKAANDLALASMGFNLSDAQRKERIAVGREALGNVKDTEAARLAAYTTGRKELTDRAGGAAKVAQAFRPIGGRGAGAGGAGKLPQVDRETAALQDKLIDLKADPKANPAQVKALQDKIDARMKIIAATKTSEKGPETLAMEADKLAAMTDKDIDALVSKEKFLNADWQEAMGDSIKQKQVERAMRNEYLTRRNKAAAVNKNSGNNTPPPPPGYETNPSR